MGIDLKAIDRAITKTENFIVETANKEIRKVAVKVSSSLIFATPVDTGRARSNWYATISSPTNKINNETRDKSGANAIARNNAVISNAKINNDIFITNNLPYIGKLNDGHSAQAPAGFVEKALQAIK